MSSVYISGEAVEDLYCIFDALINWDKGALELHHALRYIDDIEIQCYSLVHKTHHFPTRINTHKQYGKWVLKYRRSPSTTWYIIYNIDKNNNFLIKRIISNHISK